MEDVTEFAEFFDGHMFVNEKGKSQAQLHQINWAFENLWLSPHYYMLLYLLSASY